MTILDPFGGPWALFWHHFAIEWVTDAHRGTLEGPKLQTGFSTIFDGFWVSLWRPFWITFWYFLTFEASKSMSGLLAWLLLIFKLKLCWFLMSQPLICIVNTDVFIRFHFFDFFMNLMISGTCLDLILVTFGGLVAPFLWFAGLLYRYRNFNEFLGSLLAPQNKRTWSFHG